MTALTLAKAQTIATAALGHARTSGFKALSIVVLDARGAVVAAASEDGTSLKRFEIALGKARARLRWASARAPSARWRSNGRISSPAPSMLWAERWSRSRAAC